MKPPLFTDVVVFLLILLFGYTSLTKGLSNSSFRAVLELVMNRTGAAVTAFLVPTLEAVIVLLLLFVRTRLTGLYCSAFLLTAFTLYLVYMLAAFSHLPCSCGGVIGKMSWRQHVAFNLFFIGLAAVAIRKFKIHPAPLPPPAQRLA